MPFSSHQIKSDETLLRTGLQLGLEVNGLAPFAGHDNVQVPIAGDPGLSDIRPAEKREAIWPSAL